MTVAITEFEKRASLRKLVFEWTSNASGAASGTTTAGYDGIVAEAIFDPDSGDTQPTNEHDITLVDGDGHDVLLGTGANLSNAAATYKAASNAMGVVFDSALTLNVSGAGSGKSGTVTIYLA